MGFRTQNSPFSKIDLPNTEQGHFSELRATPRLGLPYRREKHFSFTEQESILLENTPHCGRNICAL